jgi:hypothetical protein
LRCANSISTRFLSWRDRSNASVLASARATSWARDQASIDDKDACCTSTTLRSFCFRSKEACPNSARGGKHTQLRSLASGGNLHGRNLACALMRSRVHNRTRDRGGEPIRLTEGEIGPRSSPHRAGGALSYAQGVPLCVPADRPTTTGAAPLRKQQTHTACRRRE